MALTFKECATVLLFWIGALLPTFAAESSHERLYKEAERVLDSIPEQAKLGRAICEEQLARGVQRKLWTEADKQVCVAWLEQLFTDLWADEVWSNHSEMEWSEFVKRVNEPRDSNVSTNPACTWFINRVTALNQFREDARRGMYVAALNRCEEIWMGAADPKDIEPATRILQNLRKRTPATWNGIAWSRTYAARISDRKNTFPEGKFAKEYVSAAFDFLAVLGPQPPLLFPDPMSEPAKFREVDLQWQRLRGKLHGFTLRPGIVAHYRRLRWQYYVKMEALRRELNAMILADRSAAEFEKALLIYAVEKPADIPAASPASRVRLDEKVPDPADYRALLSDPIPRHLFETSDIRACRNWLGFRQAEESGDAEQMLKSARDIEGSSNRFSPEVVAHVLSRVKPYIISDPEPAWDQFAIKVPSHSSDDPVRDLVSSLESNPRLLKLAEAWRRVRDREGLDEAGPIEPLDVSWVWIAQDPTNRKALELRERAAKYALSSLLGSPIPDSTRQPFSNLLIDALERASAEGSKEKIKGILALDRAYDGIPIDLREAYRKIAMAIPDPAADPPVKIERLRKLVGQATSPAAAEYATNELKKLRDR